MVDEVIVMHPGLHAQCCVVVHTLDIQNVLCLYVCFFKTNSRFAHFISNYIIFDYEYIRN